MGNKYLEILDLAPGATGQEIRKAYRNLAKKYHPDINKSESARDAFIKVTEAYKFLTEAGPRPSDEQVSYDYDPYRHEYDELREQAKAYARQQAFEEALNQQRALKKLFSAFKLIILFILIFQMLVAGDYFLEEKVQKEVIYKVSENYRVGEGGLVHISDNIIFTGLAIEVPPKVGEGIGDQEAMLFYSPIFNLFKFGQTTVDGTTRLLMPLSTKYTVLRFMIPLGLLFSIIFFFLEDTHVNKITILIVSVITFFINLFIVIG